MDSQIEDLFTLDYEEFVNILLKELISLSIEKNLLNDIIEVSVDPIKSNLLSVIRDEKIENILNEER